MTDEELIAELRIAAAWHADRLVARLAAQAADRIAELKKLKHRVGDHDE